MTLVSPHTSISLINNLREPGAEEAWRRLVRTYTPHASPFCTVAVGRWRRPEAECWPSSCPNWRTWCTMAGRAPFAPACAASRSIFCAVSGDSVPAPPTRPSSRSPMHALPSLGISHPTVLETHIFEVHSQRRSCLQIFLHDSSACSVHRSLQGFGEFRK